jgi:hypothetical protein
VTPLAASTPEGSNPQGGEQVLGQEQIAVADVVGMMRSFQRMSEALISRSDRDEARAPAPAEVPPRAPAVTGSIHRELEKVKFPKFFGAPDGAAAEAWLENMAMCFALRDYTSNMKVCMAVFQLKGSALLWWKTLLPQLNMAVEDVSWELSEERFRERYLSEEFIERQLNEFNALRQGGRTVPEYEARFMELLRYAPHLNSEKLKVNRFVLGLNSSMRTKVFILMPQTLHDVVQKAVVQDEFSFTGMASEAKQKVGGRVTSCALNLREFVTRVILYVTILGSYDVVIGMDWLESHEAIRNCKTKRSSLVDDEGQRRVIVGQEPGSIPEVHLFLTATEEYVQGVQALCDPRSKRKGSSRRSRTPSGGEGVCGHISRGVAWDAARKRIGVYYRPETGD